MLDNLKRQEAVSPMTPLIRAQTLEMLFELQTLYFGDDEAVTKYGEPTYWEGLSGGLLTCRTLANDDDNEKDDPKENETSQLNLNLLEAISSKGYHVLPPPPCSRVLLSPTAFSTTLENLAKAGWPPQFLLMYNETWELLKDVIRLIGDHDNFYIESDVNIWSLRKEINTRSNTTPGTYIGGNFVKPHRDMVYNVCHDQDNDQATSLSVWIPLNPSGATNTNGCMRILPIEEDDFFYSPHHPSHTMNSNYTDQDTAKLSPCAQFGSCVWDPTCVHWGGSCEKDAQEEPRSSLAFTIRLGEKVAEFGIESCSASKQTTTTGPEACLVKNCGEGGPKRRLQVVAKSLLSYSHHWPSFPFEGFRENMGLSL